MPVFLRPLAQCCFDRHSFVHQADDESLELFLDPWLHSAAGEFEVRVFFLLPENIEVGPEPPEVYILIRHNVSFWGSPASGVCDSAHT